MMGYPQGTSQDFRDASLALISLAWQVAPGCLTPCKGYYRGLSGFHLYLMAREWVSWVGLWYGTSQNRMDVLLVVFNGKTHIAFRMMHPHLRWSQRVHHRKAGSLCSSLGCLKPWEVRSVQQMLIWVGYPVHAYSANNTFFKHWQISRAKNMLHQVSLWESSHIGANGVTLPGDVSIAEIDE